MWKISESIEFSDGYRVNAILKSNSGVELLSIWVTIKKNKDGKLSVKPSDNWELLNKNLQLLLINEIKYKITEEKYEN